MQNIAKKIFRAVLSMILTFLAGLGLYSAVPDLNSSVAETEIQSPEQRFTPRIRDEPIGPKEKQKKETTTPRPRLGDSCSTCGMG